MPRPPPHVCSVLVICPLLPYAKNYLSQKADKIQFQYNEISEKLDPAKWCHPEIPTRQMLWLLTCVCLQNVGDYWIRHIRPDWTEDFVKTNDKNTHENLKLCTGMNIIFWSSYSQKCMCLPMSIKGCEFRQVTDRRRAQFVGAMAQSTPQLFNRKDNSDNETEERLPMPKLSEFLEKIRL